jgi:hypothetical protein
MNANIFTFDVVGPVPVIKHSTYWEVPVESQNNGR